LRLQFSGSSGAGCFPDAAADSFAPCGFSQHPTFCSSACAPLKPTSHITPNLSPAVINQPRTDLPPTCVVHLPICLLSEVPAAHAHTAPCQPPGHHQSLPGPV